MHNIIINRRENEKGTTSKSISFILISLLQQLVLPNK